MPASVLSSAVIPTIGDALVTVDWTIQAFSPRGIMSAREGATRPEMSWLTTSFEGETSKLVLAQFCRGPAPRVGSMILESLIFAIVISPEAVLSATFSL